MKDEIHILETDKHRDIKRKVAEWIDYYNNERGQRNLQKLAPREYYRFITTGEYPLSIPIPKMPEKRVRKRKKPPVQPAAEAIFEKEKTDDIDAEKS